jgi:hypothetical protein
MTDKPIQLFSDSSDKKSNDKVIASSEEFLEIATSLVDFENTTRGNIDNSAQPATRVSGLEQLASQKKPVKLKGHKESPDQDKNLDSEVTPFPHDRGKPPSSRPE